MPAAHFIDSTTSIPLSSLPHLLEHHAKRIPDAPVILAPGRAPLSYGRLYRHIGGVGHALRAKGIGRDDRVIVVLPNGPELAVAILAVMASAVCVPMNPAYGAEELHRYYSDLRPDALIIADGSDSPARRVALSRGIRIVELSIALEAEAGLFTLSGGEAEKPLSELVNPADVALLAHTSGTTSRPKIIPQTHGHLCRSAYDWSAALKLKETDRCLNVMPLFHGHGLTATVLASLAAGASVICTPGPDMDRFFSWLTTFRPTWYSAVPTVHQAILAEARHHRERAMRCRLRFIRSVSAPLPLPVFAELEKTFETCVMNCYAMAETSDGPIACNPLPPGQRKAGSVGLPVGLDVAIIDEGGNLLPRDHAGQIVARGPIVVDGYDGDPTATKNAFANGWLKTGDLGFLDGDGYLFITGRSREVINRGGEKISPLEVDAVLLEHPAVAEAVTFSAPHPTLGEDVAAAVVLRPGAKATPQDIRQFVVGRVADFKVPRQVLIVSEVPKGPTGKLQRIGLAAKLGIENLAARRSSFAAPRTALEKALAESWAEILHIEQIGIEDNFFALGGDSLSAIRVLAHVYDMTGREFDMSRFFEAPTIAKMAQHLETMTGAGQAGQPTSGIARAPREDGVPTSIAQERVWELQRVLPGIPFFNILYALRITSALDTLALERSINEIVRRHEILRTTFAVVDGQCVQIIASQLPLRLGFDDLHTLPESKKDTAGHQIIQEELLHCFDLVHGPLLRARLMRLAEREHLLLINTHNAIADGWSLSVLVGELVVIYEALSTGVAPPLKPLSIQYADFAYWQRHWQSHPKVVAQLAYWREQLRDPLPMLAFAPATPRHTIDGLHPARRELALPASLLEDAKRFSQQEGGTLFMTLTAALKMLLYCYLGQEDLRVATHVANRNRPGTEGLIGPLVNTVILRTNLGGDPNPREIMRRVRATTLAAFGHQDLPFEELVETLARERALKAAALAQVMFVLHNASLRPTLHLANAITLEEANPTMSLPLVTATNFDFTLTLHEGTHGLVGSCVYKQNLFDEITVDHLLGDFQSVLEQMVTQPERPLSAIRVALTDKLSKLPPRT
jgi:acyl-CoA synthetase (AMP-forming)/AMP-acid ligase II/acyl carrier protein